MVPSRLTGVRFACGSRQLRNTERRSRSALVHFVRGLKRMRLSTPPLNSSVHTTMQLAGFLSTEAIDDWGNGVSRRFMRLMNSANDCYGYGMGGIFLH